jgi:hypothetical protein
MLGGSVALIDLGIAITAALAMPNPDDKNTTVNVLAVVGLASSLGCIPLFISAGNNKRKAAEITFNMQKMPMLPVVANRGVLFQPALCIKVAL